MSGISFHNAEPALRNFIIDATDDLSTILGESLVSVILHGSLSMGSFHPPKSDVDLLVIVDELTEDLARRLYALFEHHHATRPYAGGMEVGVVLASEVKSPVAPLAYLVHFSETTTGFRPWIRGEPLIDEDLIAHLMVARLRGLSLFGRSPQEVIGEICWSDYLASVRGDIDWILDDQNIMMSPYYCILNLCRWAMMTEAKARIIPSKDEAGLWALTNLPDELKGTAAQALAAYRNSYWPQTISQRQLAGGPWHRKPLIEFRDYIRSRYTSDSSA